LLGKAYTGVSKWASQQPVIDRIIYPKGSAFEVARTEGINLYARGDSALASSAALYGTFQRRSVVAGLAMANVFSEVGGQVAYAKDYAYTVPAKN